MMLTDTKLRSLVAGEKPLKVIGGGGLHVLVNPNGSKLWRYAYRFLGKEKLLTLGAYPAVSLRAARLAREAPRGLLDQGEDPGHARKQEKRRQRVAAGHIFRSVADEWFESQKARRADSYSVRLRSRLDDDLMPELGDRPIASIEPIEVLDAIRKTRSAAPWKWPAGSCKWRARSSALGLRPPGVSATPPRTFAAPWRPPGICGRPPRRKGEVDVWRSVECSHVFGLLLQRSRLLALMKSADWLPNYVNELEAL